MVSLINYYIIILYFAINYDIKYELTGGPATMFFGLMDGPIMAIVLTPITYLLIRFLQQKNIKLISGLIVMFQLLVFIILVSIIGYVVVF